MARGRDDRRLRGDGAAGRTAARRGGAAAPSDGRRRLGRRPDGRDDAAATGVATARQRQSGGLLRGRRRWGDRKSTRLNSSHLVISYAVFCLKKKKNTAHLYRLCAQH